MKELNRYVSAVVVGIITLLSITPSAHALKSSTLDTANSYGVEQQQTISQYQSLPPLGEYGSGSQQRAPATCGYSGLPPLNSTQKEFDRWDRCQNAERAKSRAENARQQQRDRQEEEANERAHQNQLRWIDRMFH